ncbi:hypothetical protein FOH10_29480 [Nocardia otitidiscaviarum]|uniref:Uncharacterized protein n=1 Tax=Nocardia otitidiscaviarum TaxID=1823 RepID=A0A516NTR1_9NOCA|nr:hypothetical protein [Nocardia otitidiscaviarum]MCP9621585.1 hypothetical protein [Nocardia otitidiscaviarum]QDP82251.1 hypothetical protein FOH10_29480 [Nocardia otitidiscaviarum]
MTTTNESERYAALDRRYRPQIIAGLRGAGLTYGQIRELLGISLRQVETCLGEAAELRAQGYRVGEIAEELGVPAGSMGRILAPPRRRMLTERQSQVLSAVSHMRGMQIDLLAEFLNVYESTAYAIVQALIDHGAVHPLAKVQRGRAWVYPKRDVAARYLGWRPQDWQPSLMYANHDRAVVQARIMLVGSDPELWVSERVLRHEASKRARAEAERLRTKPALEFSSGHEPRPDRPHIHDGWFLGVVDGTHGWWALEVELTKKDPTYLDTALRGAVRAARDAQPHQLIGLLYLCRTQTVMRAVDAAHARLPRELAQVKLLFAVGDLDEEWQEFITRRRELRAAKKANRLRRTAIHLPQEAS